MWPRVPLGLQDDTLLVGLLAAHALVALRVAHDAHVHVALPFSFPVTECLDATRRALNNPSAVAS